MFERLYYALLQIFIFLIELLFVIPRPRLWRFFLFFQIEYLVFSPYYYANKNAEDDFIYGFTPLFTFFGVLKQINKLGIIIDKEPLLDLGCGDSRNVLAFAKGSKVNVLGVDQNDRLIQKAGIIARALKLNNLTLQNADFFIIDWSHYGIIWLAWSTFSDNTVDQICNKIKEESLTDTIIVTVSFPIEMKGIKVIHQGRYLFSWGVTDVFVHQKVET